MYSEVIISVFFHFFNIFLFRRVFIQVLFFRYFNMMKIPCFDKFKNCVCGFYTDTGVELMAICRTFPTKFSFRPPKKNLKGPAVSFGSLKDQNVRPSNFPIFPPLR